MFRGQSLETPLPCLADCVDLVQSGKQTRCGQTRNRPDRQTKDKVDSVCLICFLSVDPLSVCLSVQVVCCMPSCLASSIGCLFFFPPSRHAPCPCSRVQTQNQGALPSRTSKTWPRTHLATCLPALPVYLSVCPSIPLSICLCVSVPIHQSLRPSYSLPVFDFLPAVLYLPAYDSVCLCVCLSDLPPAA